MRGRVLVLLPATSVLGACSGPEAMLDPFGPPAEQTAGLWWYMFALGGAVYVVVMALALIGFLNGRRSQRTYDQARATGSVALSEVQAERQQQDERAETVGRRLIIFGGIVGSAIILLALNVVSVPMTAGIADRGASATLTSVEADELVIDVSAEKFWWRVTYPQYDIETANEIHIPTGERVRVRLSSPDVIHSFWIPKLAGKIDATPGHTTELILETDEVGRYRGRCTEFCGLAHAQMVVYVVAQEAEDFDAWLASQQQPQPLPTDARIEEGRQIFFGSSCAYCHAVQGHGPPNTIGPDLTYLATRETIAGGVLPNTRGILAGWIVDPQSQKPGNLMPGTQIAGDELNALLDYLESLS